MGKRAKVGFFVALWRVWRDALFPILLFSCGGGVRKLSLDSETLSVAMVDPEAILS